MPEQEMPPLVAALLAHRERHYLGFHMPGHHQGRGAWPPWRSLLGEAVFSLDLTELPGLDNLQDPQGVIRGAAAAAAAYFGADETWLLVNGATVGILAVLLTVCRPGDLVVLPRNCHQAVIHGLVLSGARPVYLPVQGSPELGLPGMVTTGELRRACPAGVRLTVLLHPSYYGLTGALAEQVEFAHEQGSLVLVDEAHGAHFRAGGSYPPTALSCGADFVVQGAHKVLGAFTQAALLHRRGQEGVAGRLRETLRLLQTSSPSYLLLASLDVARRQLQEQEEEWEAVARLGMRLRERINRIPGLKAPGGELLQVPGVAAFDPARLLVNTTGLGVSGFAAAEWLRANRRILVEMADFRNLVLILGPGDAPRAEQLLAGLTALGEAAPDGGGGEPPSGPDPLALPLPPQVLSPRDAFLAAWEEVPREAAVGRVAAGVVAPYPPGVPVLCPGERVTPEVVAFLADWEAAGGVWPGQRRDTLRVVAGS